MLYHGLLKFTIFKLIIAYKDQRINAYVCYNRGLDFKIFKKNVGTMKSKTCYTLKI